MIKKIFFGMIAAGAMSVPFASAAWADIADNNPGVPGNYGVPPGCSVGAVARAEPGLVPKAIDFAGTPGNTIKQFTPRNAG